jgi:hypothetical protein
MIKIRLEMTSQSKKLKMWFYMKYIDGGLAFYLHTFIEKTFMTAKFLLLLVSSALHHHTDDNVLGTDVTMPRVRWVKFIYIYSQICTIDKISKLFPLLK